MFPFSFVTFVLLFVDVWGQVIHFTQQNYGSLNETEFGLVTLAVEKVGANDQPFSVIIEVNGTNDFSNKAWPITFPASSNHSSVQSFEVIINDDDIPEDDETYIFTLRTPSHLVSVDEPISAQVTILANDDPHGIVGIHSSSDINVVEVFGVNQSISIPLTRQRGSFGDVAVTYTISQINISDQQADASDVDEDLFPASGEVVFGDGENEKELTIFVSNDQIPENNEHFVLKLVEGINGVKINESSSKIRIVVEGNDSPLRFSKRIYHVDESSPFVSVTVYRGLDSRGQQRVGPDDSVVSINYNVVGNSAMPLEDYFVPVTRILQFQEGQHQTTLQIFLVNDDKPELAENFTIHLLENTINGDAIVVEPTSCIVVIEMNDKANGVVAIDYSKASYDIGIGDERAFVVDEDDSEVYKDIAVVRHGGVFQQISVDWMLKRNISSDEEEISSISPTSGKIYLNANSTTTVVKLKVNHNDIPSEAVAFVFSLLPSSLTGGAEMDEESEAILILADSDDVYGVFSIDVENSRISIDENRNERHLVVEVARLGGSVGEVEVDFSSSYIPHGEEQGVWGVLEENKGKIIFHDGQESHDVIIPIKQDAFLQLDSLFKFELNSAKLIDRNPIITPKTPQIDRQNISLLVTPTLANGEIGFDDVIDVYVNEPGDNEGAVTVTMKIHREGLSGEANIEVSYRSSGKNKAEVGNDYIPGPNQVFMTPGQSMVEISIDILPDDLPELEEVILVRLDHVSPSNQKLKQSSIEKKIIISENDSPGGVFQFSSDSIKHFVIEEREVESIVVEINRDEGDLASRFVQYDVIPNGENQFYSVPRPVFFGPGKRSELISLIPIDDEIPELDQNYTLVLREFGSPASVVGDRTSISVTILASDEPHGVFEFENKNENGREFIQQTIGESKDATSFVASYSVKRNRGVYGFASVTWKLLPEGEEDVMPSSGILEFADGQSEGIITVQSVADNIPEPTEEFILFLSNATHGASVGHNRNASLIIKPNDKAIYFKGEGNLQVHEGDDLTLMLHRDATGSDQTSLMIRTFINETSLIPATPGDDFENVTKVVTFPPGVLDVRVTIHINQDQSPEDDEIFYVELFDARGDYVTHGNKQIKVTIVQNDNANGVFKFDKPYDVTMHEGVTESIRVLRSYGEFGNVDVHWKIVPDDVMGDEINVDLMQEVAKAETMASEEFTENEGILYFAEDQNSAEIFVTPKSDSTPEYEESFILMLVNVTNGKPRLSSNLSELLIRIIVEENDYPHGWMSMSSSDVEVAEDVEMGVTNTTTVQVERKMGTDGNVKVLWEIYSSDEEPLPRCKDLLLSGSPQGGAVTSVGRLHVGTFAVDFLPGSFVEIEDFDQPKLTNDGFSYTFWIKPDLTGFAGSGDGFVTMPLFVKYYNQTLISSVVIEMDEGYVDVRFKYRSDEFSLQDLAVSLDRDVLLTDGQWHHLVVTYYSREVILFVDGEQRGTMSTVMSSYYDITGDNTVIFIGKEKFVDGVTFHGLLQDVRVYFSPLSPILLRQLFRGNAHYDITPISGYINYGPGDVFRNISITAVDDKETEINETFRMLLIDATGGSEINNNNMSTKITVLKSDNANGLFSFAQPCQPDHVTEGESVICYITRSRGSDGDVTVHWQTTPSDFVNSEGKVEFLSGEREKSFELYSYNDNVPEIDEVHNITLVETDPHDGVRSSASYSGASIDENDYLTFVEIRRNDKPNGILQFSDKSPPTSGQTGRIEELVEAPIVYVTEESGHVTLMVERAAGWFGHVTIEWRTRDGSAISQQEPRDFESIAGTLTLEDGQGHAFIDVKLIDDEVSELEKYFFVVLSAPTGGATLNNASRVMVVIEPSDDAFGVFKFNKTSTLVEVHEPQEGSKELQLEVVRGGGDLDGSVVSWMIEDDKDDDITPHQGQVEFVEGQRSQFIHVEVKSDKLPEFDEIKQIKLTKVSQGTLGGLTSATIKIFANDDPRGHLVFMPTSVTASESDGFANLTVQRLGGTWGTIRVYYATIDTSTISNSSSGVAVADVDFTNVSDSILIHENNTVSYIIIPLIDDVTPETEELFFVQLLSAELVSSGVSVPNSPRIGLNNETLVEVAIIKNDSPHGVLELSDTSIRVNENVSDVIFINIIRKLGTFGEVSVGVNVIPGQARSQEDYNLISSQVTLLDGESIAAVPLRIVNDFTPELAEDFMVELLPDSVTGGAVVGVDTTCHVTIEESDDPYGALGISVDDTIVDEPENRNELPITFTIDRKNGLRSVVAARWRVFVEPAHSVAPSGGVSGADDGGDVDVRSGVVNFVSNETSQQFTIKIQPDDLPEDDERIIVRLVEIVQGYRGRIDTDHDEAHVVVKANDRPYGDVILANHSYITEENSVATVSILRRGGLHGSVRVVYSTSEVDLVSEMLDNEEDLLTYFQHPELARHNGGNVVDVTSSDKPLTTCAELCLREKACVGFFYTSSSFECKWITDDLLDPITYITSDDVTNLHPPSFYGKDEILASYLYKSQARSGMDFIPITGASAVFEVGQNLVNISIDIMHDDQPELNEYFKLQLLSVEVIDSDVDQINIPLLLKPSSARMTILENDFPYGKFVLRSSNPDAEKQIVEVEEREKLSLEMVVERKGGSVGDVTVDWIVAGGNASRNYDFTGDDATLKFAHGETSKVISLTVLDDKIPEPNEDIVIVLVNPSGGAVVGSSENETRVVILANDKVGGVVSFTPESRSLIGQEGKSVTLHLVRSEPAYGRCEVMWNAHSVNGHDVRDGLNATQGRILFPSGVKEGKIILHLTSDEVPEVKEEYRITLTSAKSLDVAPSGGAVIEEESSQAQISIEDSDDPHGVFQVDPTSQRMNVAEDAGTINIFITRQFGSIGKVRVHYDVIPGTLSTLNPDIEVAGPGRDFTYNSNKSYVEFEDGVTSAAIVMQIIDDDIPELNEIFHVNLTYVTMDNEDNDVTTMLPPEIDEGNSLAQVVIDANDGTKGVVRFDTDSVDVFVDETMGNIQLNIRRDRGTYGSVGVFVFTQNLEAIIGKDFQCLPQTVHFDDGQDSAVYNINIINDAKPEGDEIFEVLLRNPSNGLRLGNSTKSIVTIRSNDDAHGRLAFANERHIKISEPEHANVSNSQAELVITRSPPEGVFGQVSVKFKIEPLTSPDDDVIDLTPNEGFVVIEDGVEFEVLEISAVADDFPELEECFRVILFEPQHGATLKASGIGTEVCVKENDAPYGKFVVYPSNQRNVSREYRVRESKDNHMMRFDVVREQGLLGKVAVDVLTIAGSAKPLSNVGSFNPGLNLIQTFNASNGEVFHNFCHHTEDYLIYLTSDLKHRVTSPVGGSGSLPSLEAGIHSTIYKWRGVYQPQQTIETDGASAVKSFVADDVVYIFVCNSGENGRRETFSRLYKLTEEGSLLVLQNIETKGATSVSVFESDEETYLFITNSMDNNYVSSIDSVLFRFNGHTETLQQTQTIPTRGASGSDVFQISGDKYIAIANRYDSESDSDVTSIVYKWNRETLLFTQRQIIPLSHANDVVHYHSNGQHFLILSHDFYGNQETMQSNIEIFQVFVNDHVGNLIFRPHQSISLHRVGKLEILTANTHLFNKHGGMQEKFVNGDHSTMLCSANSILSKCFFFNHQSQLFVDVMETIAANQVLPYIITADPEPVLVVAIATKKNLRQNDSNAEVNHSQKLGFLDFSMPGIYDIVNVGNNSDGDFVEIRNTTTLTFEPGVEKLPISVTLIDDETPEIEETFTIGLGNSQDRRAVVDGSWLEVIVEASDDAFGVIGFHQNSVEKQVEETSEDHVISLDVIRSKSTFGEVVVDWKAVGAIHDISPISGQVKFGEGEEISTIQLIVLADDKPEIDENVFVQLHNPRTVRINSSSSPPRLNSDTLRSTVVILSNDSPHGVVSWSPNSLQIVVNEAETPHGASQLVTLELIRTQGALGDIEVHFRTSVASNLPQKSRAMPNVDFIERKDYLVMRENSTRAAISISVIPDDIPEDIETFYVRITRVSLIGESQFSTGPGLGPAGSEVAEVTIDENDNSRGFIQFNVTRNSEGAIEAYELPRVNNTLKVPLVRIPGLFRTVGIDWLARPETAKNSDFFPSSGSVQFVEDMTSSYIEMLIADDDEVEFLESFTIQLVGTSGGVKLGGDLKVSVNILPNDSPSGMFGFIKLSQNLDESTSIDDPRGIVELKVERFQGSSEDVTLLWEVEESARMDLTPVSGKLVFPAHVRSQVIRLRSLPDQIMEGAEEFEIRLLTATGGAEISPVAGVAKVIINADPGSAGVISINGCEDGISVDEDEEGIVEVKLKRDSGIFGRVGVRWEITPSDSNTFLLTKGETFFDDLQNETSIFVETMDDKLPELLLNFDLRLISATGGGEIHSSLSLCKITVLESDNPHGLFQFSQPVYYVKENDHKSFDHIHQSESDTSSFATVTVLRTMGHFGEVTVDVKTWSGSASPNVDYYPINKRLVFTDGDSHKVVNIEIIDDNIPEGPNEFYVNITDVNLLSGSSHDETPQLLGDIVWSVVLIDKSDGAEGRVEFGGSRLEVNEDAGVIQVPLIRSEGSYGGVSVLVNSVNQTARRNVDFLLPSSGLVVDFEDGQMVAAASIRLLDDEEMEEEEKFMLAISKPLGGVRLGNQLITEIVIRKSDFPNGLIQFVGHNHVTVANPSVTDGATDLRFTIERRGGNEKALTIRWRLSRTSPFIMPTTSASSLDDDVGRPHTGSFSFADGEGGQREIVITILPHDGSEEVQESFVINIENYSPAELSVNNGNAVIVVQKKGHPNGIVGFSDSPHEVVASEADSGSAHVVFPIFRDLGISGDVNISWVVDPINTDDGANISDLAQHQGHVLIYNGQSEAELIINVKSDSIPEIVETFQVRLVSVLGGAEINENNSTMEFIIKENDFPHGIFGLLPLNQLIHVDKNLKRLLKVNVTREEGTFGQVLVGFKVEFDSSESRVSYLTTNTGSVTFTSSTRWSVEEIPIRSSANLAVGDKFIIQLTSVKFLNDESSTSPPVISRQHSKTSASVPPEVGNAQVGFFPTVVHVSDVSRDMCKIKFVRNGLYGSVTVHWSSGYPARRAPLGVTQGRTLPSSGEVVMDNLQSEADLSVKILRSSGGVNAFALHIPQVKTSSGGGVSLMSHHDVAEIDPCGAVRFADYSKTLEVDRTQKQVNLTVERLYGSRYDIIINYIITPITAQPGIDYITPVDDVITMKNAENEAKIQIHLLKSFIPQQSRKFIVNLTMTSQPQDIYAGLSPRIVDGEDMSEITIPESADVRGVLSFNDVLIKTQESQRDDSQFTVIMIKINRKVGALGDVGVMMSTVGGGEYWEDTSSEMIVRDRDVNKASAGHDYEDRQIDVHFKDGQVEASVPLVILDDILPEPEEMFYIYLHSATGGARVDDRKGFAKVLIEASDVPSGWIGFDEKNYVIDEDSSLRSVNLKLNRAYSHGDATVQWRAVKSLQPLDGATTQSFNVSDSLELGKELEITSGSVTCSAENLDCYITLTLKDDDISEFSHSFFVVIYGPSEGAKVDKLRNIANVTVLESDAPHGQFQFDVSSRFVVVTKGQQSVSLMIERVGGDVTPADVTVISKQLPRAISIAGTTFFPAVRDVDFQQFQQKVHFKPREREKLLNFKLPIALSQNPLPQIFQISLDHASGKSVISEAYHTSNVTIVESGRSKMYWGVYESLQQMLDDTVIQGILKQLSGFAGGNLEEEQIRIFHGCLEKILDEGKKRRLSDVVLQEIYKLFCQVLDPHRLDAVYGYSPFSSLFDKFALILATESGCVPTEVTTHIMNTCAYAFVQTLRSFPELINGFTFHTKDSNFFQLPKELLDVKKHGVDGIEPKCFDVYFVEYSSQVWFQANGETGVMSNKIFSVGVGLNHVNTLTSPLKYRVYTKDLRISPEGAECVIWNEPSSRWLSRDMCHVIEDSSNFVDCECRHMSVFAARGPTDNLAGYNEATYAACFIVMVGSFLVVLSHHLCSKQTTFATKLLMHMMFACGSTQLLFVIGTLVSKQLTDESCAVLAVFLHYFWLAQFVWIFMQSINILQVLALNNENTHRLYVVHFVLSWGIPAIIILLYVMIMYALGSKSIFQCYGDVHKNGEICMIKNVYGGLLGAVVPACVCLAAPLVVGLHLYQTDQSWKQYDDMFRGRYNSTEIPLLFCFFFLIAITWLFGGLHLAYGQMWMLVMFILFNFLLGFYLLVAYGILHNQLVRPIKAIYEESPKKNRGEGQTELNYVPNTSFESQTPSESGIVHDKTTQSFNPPAGNERWEDESMGEDDAEFDDLMFALNNGSQEGHVEKSNLASSLSTVSSHRSVEASHAAADNIKMPIHDTHL